jgi:hypothetical protein
MNNVILKILIVSAATVVALSSSAHAMNFDFSFSNDPAQGNVAGTVYGEIFGLTNNATSDATNVVIDSYPAGITGLPAAPFNIPDYAASLGEYIVDNGFTVTNGVITGANYQIYGGNFDLASGAYNALVSPDDQFRVQDTAGFAGVTFTAATPLPSAWTMLIAGFVGLGFFAYHGSKNRSAVIAAA